MLSSIGSYIRQHWQAFALGAIFSFMNSGALIATNYIIQLFLDDLVVGGLTGNLLTLYIGGFVLLAFTAYFSRILLNRYIFGQSINYQTQMRESLFSRLLQLRSPFYEQFRSGDLMTRMTSDVDMMGNAMSWGFLIVIGDGTYMLGVILLMIFSISLEATIVSMIPLCIFSAIIYFVGQEVDRRYEVSREAVAQLSHEVLEVVDGVRVMRAYGNKELDQQRFQQRTQEVVTTSNRLIFLNASFGPVSRLFSGISNIVGLFYGARMVSLGRITIGQLVAFQMYLGLLNGFVWGVADIVAIYKQAGVSFRKIMEIFQAQDHVQQDGRIPIDSIDSIEFKDYSFTFPGDEKPTIESVSFTLSRGETLGIVGKTGSGKSTIVRQLLRQYPVTHPESLLINGRPITDYVVSDLESMMGYVPQEHVLFSRTVKHNIEFGNQEAGEAELAHAIETADFAKDLQHMSDGLETLIGEKGASISGGQKQRISIARALIREPELLILDDSLSAVDAKTERAIIANIAEVRSNQTNIIITHRLSAVAEADYVIVLEKGQIVESGTPNQLIANKGWYYEQYMRQQIGEDMNEDI